MKKASAPPETPPRAGPPVAGADEVLVARLDITVVGQAMHIEIPISTGPISGAPLVRIARALGEAIGARAVEVETAAGRPVSCRQKCAACCRHLVPLPVAEARAINALVEAMPEARRSEIRRRFAAIRATLAEAGLLEQILDTATLPADGATALNLGYFRLALACPFLEDESCSIYADRPLACREYMVTSPAAFCANPADGKIAGVPRPLRLHDALLASDPESPSDRPTWVALPNALDWVASHPAPAARIPGPDLLRRFLEAAFRHDLPAPAPPRPGCRNALIPRVARGRAMPIRP